MEEIKKCVSIIEEICLTIEPGKKMLQKLMYLMERKGVNLNLNYTIHFFGPYSSKLDDVVHILESKDIISIDTSGKTHKISMNGMESNKYEYTDEEKEIVEFVLSKFSYKTALELEALTTIDYVFENLLEETKTDEDIIEGVIKIKGSKFKRDFLQSEIEILREYEFIA